MTFGVPNGGNSGPAVLPSSSGYGVFEALKDPVFVSDFVPRYYARTLGGLICAQDILPAVITRVGSTVVFRRPPRASVFDYTKNQDLESDGLNTVPMEMTIDRGKYFNLKLDDVDHLQIQDVDNYIDMYKYDALEQIAQRTDVELFFTLETQSHPANKGSCAGAMSGAYDMGSLGAPVVFDRTSALDVMNNASAVLSEANVDFADRYIVLPICAQPILSATTVLANALNSGLPRSMQLIGMEAYPGPIAGFSRIYFSNLLPRRWDPVAGVWTYACPFGRRDATGFITQMAKNEVVPVDSRSFHSFWRGLFIYGKKVLRPEAVGICYIAPSVPSGSKTIVPAG